jgi:hypothetical protein
VRSASLTLSVSKHLTHTVRPRNHTALVKSSCRHSEHAPESLTTVAGILAMHLPRASRLGCQAPRGLVHRLGEVLGIGGGNPDTR